MYPVFESVRGPVLNVSLLERELEEARGRIDTLLRDKKIIAYPTDGSFSSISETFVDFTETIARQISEMDLDKHLEDVPVEKFLSEPLEAIIQGRTALCYEHINICF